RLFDDHLGPLVEALHDLAAVGRRLLWGNVAAATAGGFAVLSAPSVRPAKAEHLMNQARLLLDCPGGPTEGLADLFPVAHDGGTRLFVRRQTCCLRYRLPDAPPTCLSCRLVPERERSHRIALRLEAEVG
ncbi:MAG: (2Fe-2S)-binding protein, partial [Actinobacteria bacterium]|nr:(2Fe-2S)-binding protein [Actinomycetota bacterium]